MSVHILGLALWWERKHDELATSERLARSINTNPVVVRRLVAALKRAGLLETRRGVGGGIRVAAPPAEVNLRQIYEAVEAGRELLSLYPGVPDRQCGFGCHLEAYLREVYARSEEALKAELEKVTLADVARSVRAPRMASPEPARPFVEPGCPPSPRGHALREKPL